MMALSDENVMEVYRMLLTILIGVKNVLICVAKSKAVGEWWLLDIRTVERSPGPRRLL